jgi:hypothetical protein
VTSFVCPTVPNITYVSFWKQDWQDGRSSRNNFVTTASQ